MVAQVPRARTSACHSRSLCSELQSLFQTYPNFQKSHFIHFKTISGPVWDGYSARVWLNNPTGARQMVPALWGG